MHERAGTDIVKSGKCPFCLETITFDGGSSSTIRVACKVCGRYRIAATTATVIAHWSYPEEQWAAASYQIRRIADRPDSSLLDSALLKNLLENTTLPKPNEALDGAVMWLATHSRFPGQVHLISYPEYRSVFAAANVDAFNAYVKWFGDSGWITASRAGASDSGATQVRASLSPLGWQRYAELTRGGTYSREAFMAMPFGASELDGLLKDYFVPAVDRAGFHLRRNIDPQPAGLIDDLMRVQIRTARFVIADLTHSNRGAYWEAGFAEGLSKPVIYTCRADVFNDADPTKRTHFDTNHLSTVLWESAALKDAADRLTAMIRATLPAEAKLQD